MTSMHQTFCDLKFPQVFDGNGSSHRSVPLLLFSSGDYQANLSRIIPHWGRRGGGGGIPFVQSSPGNEPRMVQAWCMWQINSHLNFTLVYNLLVWLYEGSYFLGRGIYKALSEISLLCLNAIKCALCRILPECLLISKVPLRLFYQTLISIWDQHRCRFVLALIL